jgi:hypothetical protein
MNLVSTYPALTYPNSLARAWRLSIDGLPAADSQAASMAASAESRDQTSISSSRQRDLAWLRSATAEQIDNALARHELDALLGG